MQKQTLHNDRQTPPHANVVPFLAGGAREPEGALVTGGEDAEGKIAVVYNRGERPPEITIKQTEGRVQTVLADGVAVAIVARAEGPCLTVDDVLLVERFVAGSA